MKDPVQQPRRRWVALRDLLLISLAVSALLWLGAATSMLDLLLSAPFLVPLGLAVFCSLRWRASAAAVAARDRQEARFPATRAGSPDAESRYRSLVEHMPVVTYLDDGSGDRPQRYITPGVEHLLGFTQAEWLADPNVWHEHLHPEDRDRVLEAVRHAEETGEPRTTEYRMVAKDGRVVWVHDDARIVQRGPTPARSVWQGMVVDVTRRKEAELALREAEETYRTLVEQLPVVVYQDAVDDISTTLYVSPQYERMFGHPQQAPVGDPHFWLDHVHPADRDRVLAESKRTNETGEPFSVEYRYLAGDGRFKWVRDEAVLLRQPDGRPKLWQGVMIDVSRTKLAEETLARRDAVLAAVRFAADRFLKSRDWEAALPEVLERFGAASGATRVYVVENERPRDGELAMRQRTQWPAQGHSAWDDGASHPYSRGYVRWHATLSGGHAIHGLARNFPAVERVGPRNEGVLARVIVPVFVGEEWWGFLGFDDRERERDWPAPEIEAMEAAAGTLGAAIGRARAEERRKTAEQQVVEAQQRYRSLVESMPAVTYVDTVDEPWTTLYVSPQIETLFGYTPDEWTDPQVWTTALHPDDRERVLAAVERHNRDDEPFDVEYRLRAKDGRWTWVSDHAAVVVHEEGAIRLSQGVMLDITERRQAEEQLREADARYRAIVEHVPAATYVDRPDGSMRTLYVSPQIEEIMGVSQQRFKDEPDLWLDLMAPSHRQEIRRSYLEAIEDHRSWQGEYQIVTPEGREVWVHDETSFVTDEDGTPLFLQGVMYDVTERKHAEQALLDSERREREAAERLRALDEMKNTFLAAVSHELRSPLTSILGLSLTLEHQELATADRLDLTRRVAQNARKLDRLLKDLLDIDRLSRGIVSPQLRPTDVGALVRGVVESLELGDRSVTVEAEPVSIPIDAPKIERVVENLVMNAVRHTERDVAIWVRVWPGAAGAFLAVEDDGPGVPADLHTAIFEPFRQGPTASPHSPGTGIGLALVAMFTELHGGRAWVEERDGGGASFRVFLPGGPATPTEGEGGHSVSRRPAPPVDAARAG